ncbi:MAG TPA: glycosyltransferase family 39 protein, partial [Anaerolineae bacterium]
MNWKNNLRNAHPAISPNPDRRMRIALIAILLLALALRLHWVLVADPSPKLGGGDAPFYLMLGKNLAIGAPTPETWSIIVGPVYPIYLSFFYLLLPENLVVQAARLGQAALDMLMCLTAFDLARRIFDARVGLLTALILALDLRFIVQAGAFNTETIFIFLAVLGVWLFVAARAAQGNRLWGYAGSVVILLLSALTRPAALPLPVLLIASLLLPRPTRTQMIAAGLIAGVGMAGFVIYAVRNYQATGQITIISDGLAANFWMGSRSDGQWHGIVEFEKEREGLRERHNGRHAYIEDALQTIVGDPAAYVRLLFVKVTAAYLQPHGTVTFSGESLKELAMKAVRGQIGIADLVSAEAFWPKLYIYIFHFSGLIGGLIGV